MNNMTKKLRKMVNHRKRTIVVSKQKDFKQYKRSRAESSDSDYRPGGF